MSKICNQLTNYFVSKKHYPFKVLVLGIFSQILLLNYLGMFPGSVALTASFTLPFFLAFLFIGVSFFLIYFRYGVEALAFFVPSAPLMLLGIIVNIELISYIIKVVSLSCRLFANMFSGHVLLVILSGAILPLFSGSLTAFICGLTGPICVVIIVFFLEFFIAFLQAYVFATLGSMYLGDTILKKTH